MLCHKNYSYHFELHLNCPPHHAYADNLVRIYPKHVTHGIIPETIKKDFSISFRVKSHKIKLNEMQFANKITRDIL